MNSVFLAQVGVFLFYRYFELAEIFLLLFLDYRENYFILTSTEVSTQHCLVSICISGVFLCMCSRVFILAVLK